MTAWSLLGDALLGGLSGALGVGGLVVTVIAWMWKPDQAVSLWVVFFGGAFLLWVAVGLLTALRRSASMLGFPAMSVVKIVAPRTPHKECKCIFQLKPVVRPAVGSSVAFYWIDPDEFERDLGVGTVQRELENLNIEVTLDITYLDPEADDFLAKLLKNDADAIKRLRVADRIPAPLKTQVIAHSKAEALSGLAPPNQMDGSPESMSTDEAG